MNNKKNILVFFSGLVILLIISTLIYNKISYKTSKEIITLDEDKIKNEILTKINTMSANNLLVKLYKDSISSDNIDHKILLEGILLTLNEDGNITDKEADELYDRTNICTNMSYISLNSVEDKIKDIYGDDFIINYEDTLQNSDYLYDADTKRFYEVCISSLDKSNFIDTYIYDYDIRDNIAIVLVAVSFGKEEFIMEDETVTDKTKIKIYTDYEYKNLYKEYVYSIENDFILDETNYKDFSLYKFTFKRNNNKYIFNSLELLNK